MRSQTLMVRSAAMPRVSNHEAPASQHEILKLRHHSQGEIAKALSPSRDVLSGLRLLSAPRQPKRTNDASCTFLVRSRSRGFLSPKKLSAFRVESRLPQAHSRQAKACDHASSIAREPKS